MNRIFKYSKSMQPSLQRYTINDYIVFDNNVLSVLFSYIDQKQLFGFRLICKQWNAIALMHIKTINNNGSISNNIFKTFKHITSLNLWDNTLITDDGLKHLKQLTSLNLSFNTLITDDGLKHLKQLTSLDLCGNTLITDDGLKHLKQLTSLNLRFNRLITDDGLKHLKQLTKVLR